MVELLTKPQLGSTHQQSPKRVTEEGPTPPSAPSLPASGLPAEQFQRQRQPQDTGSLQADARGKEKAKEAPETDNSCLV